MSKFMLLSINPQYSKLIYDGYKRFEYRTRLPTRRDLPILIYESRPVKCVTGIVAGAHYLKDDPQELWEHTKFGAGISANEFKDYFRGCDTASAIELFSVYRFPRPLNLGERGLPKVPPRSFCYVDVDL